MKTVKKQLIFSLHSWQREIEELKEKMGNVSSPTSVANSVQKLKQDDLQKLHLLEEQVGGLRLLNICFHDLFCTFYDSNILRFQVMELKKKLIMHSQYSKQKHKMGDAGSLDCIRKLKAQKVKFLPLLMKYAIRIKFSTFVGYCPFSGGNVGFFFSPFFF